MDNGIRSFPRLVHRARISSNTLARISPRICRDRGTQVGSNAVKQLYRSIPTIRWPEIRRYYIRTNLLHFTSHYFQHPFELGSIDGRKREVSIGSKCISSFHWPSNISDPGNRETRYARGGQLLLRSIRRRILRGDVPLSKSSYLGEGASTGPCPSPLLSGKMEWFRSGIFFREGKEG